MSPMRKKIHVTSMVMDLTLFAIGASHGRWKPYPHSVFLAKSMQEAFTTPNSRVILSVPPRHGKTEISVVYGGAWYLKAYPRNRFLYVAHTQSLADKKSAQARDVFQSLDWGVRLSQDSSSKQNWETAIPASEGGFFAAGIGGPITGLGFDVMVIDDPIKNQMEAFSKVYRDKIYDYWLFTLRDRLQPGGSVILIMHRWHEDDLAGRLIKDGGWKVINIPAIAEEDDPLERTPGESLCRWMYDEKALAEIRREMGSRAFDAKYQGRPSIEGGNLFRQELFRYFAIEDSRIIAEHNRIPMHAVRVYQTIDPAGTTGKHSDYFVCLTYAIDTEHNLYVLDVFREKAETTRHNQIITAQREKWKPLAQYVENKTFGINIIQEARKSQNPIRPLKADTSKLIRAEPAITYYENGKIYHLRRAPWLSGFESELKSFPGGEHDDQVDALAYAVLASKEHSFNFDRYKEM